MKYCPYCYGKNVCSCVIDQFPPIYNTESFKCQDCGQIFNSFETKEPEPSKNVLQDSGNRRQFETGAVRDISEGKGRCDLLPLDVLEKILNAPILGFIEEFKKTKNINQLMDAMLCFTGGNKKHTITTILEVSKHYEDGAVKYGENNWKKGIPLHCYLDSAVRHYLKHLRGDTDEPHDRAFIWNLLGAIWTYTHKPELDDVEIDIAPNITEVLSKWEAEGGQFK